MADIKISALPGASTLTGAETIPLVQGGTTKKVTTDQFLIKDGSGNVGLGVTPNASTIPSMQSAYGISIGNNEAHQTKNAYYNSNWKYVTTTSAARFTVGEGGNDFRWYNAPSGTAGNVISWTQAMTLDASGNLGVGTASPVSKVHIEQVSYTTPGLTFSATAETGRKYQLSMVAGNNFALTDSAAAAQRLVVDTSGNMGLGVTPSAWGASAKALQILSRTSLSELSGYSYLNNNAYTDGATTRYLATAAASQYIQGVGTHSWNIAPSGTAGNPISFTQAMTLDASGDFTTANGRINLITVGRGGGGVATNTASGYAALHYNTTGASITASGMYALYSNTTGNNNTASGYAALHYNTTGYNNTASGMYALYSNTTGNNNTASGYAALHYNTTGYNNTASGRSGHNPDNDIAQYQITTDFDMTLVGHGATKDNAGQLWNSTAIGARAKVTKSNQVVLGDSNVTETLVNGDLVQKVSTTAATLTANGTLTFSIVNDTTLRISVRGSDGTTRTATVALS